MPIFFCNSDPIDLLAIEIAGLSVKAEGSIGFFGTGLKFAIATLLRTGHEITIYRKHGDGKADFIEFFTEKRQMRGQDFEQVSMMTADGPRALGFTTQLGRQWEPWMAFRELHSNVLDEKGETHSTADKEALRDRWGTVIEVSGEGIEKAWAMRHEIFLPPDARRLASVEGRVEILAGPASQDGFYRGVRAHKFTRPTIAKYNMLDKCQLTEDRTISSGDWYFQYHLAKVLQGSNAAELLDRFLVPPEGSFESTLQFDPTYPTSDEFVSAVQRNRKNLGLNQSALEVYWGARGQKEDRWEPASTRPWHEAIMAEALSLLRSLDVSLSRQEIKVVNGLGPSVLGLCSHGQIYIALSTFDQGLSMLAGTLLEEWLHREERLRDESRELQNWLLNKVIALASQLSPVTSSPAAEPSPLFPSPSNEEELWF